MMFLKNNFFGINAIVMIMLSENELNFVTDFKYG